MEEKNVLLFAVLALVALFFFSSFTGKGPISGQSVYTGERGVQTCSDSDSYNIYVPGSVTTTTGRTINEYTDRCSGGDGTRVLENYCEGNTRKFTYEWCPQGMRCSSGACVN